MMLCRDDCGWSGRANGCRVTEPVIKNLSLTIEAGQKVAIVGRTGR